MWGSVVLRLSRPSRLPFIPPTSLSRLQCALPSTSLYMYEGLVHGTRAIVAMSLTELLRQLVEPPSVEVAGTSEAAEQDRAPTETPFFLQSGFSALGVRHSITQSITHTLPRSLTHSLPHSITPSLNRSLTHTLTQSITPSLNHSIAQSLTHSLALWSHSSSASCCSSLARA